MKLRLKKKRNKLAKVKPSECYNCEHPFFGNQKFCPECGQVNKEKRITFKNFIHEVFNGFISWDSKFWTTFIPLLIKPGKVSRDYIDGKRMRYANPFRFYLTVSLVFFLVVGLTKSYDKFNELRTGKTQETQSINDQIDLVKNSLDSTSVNFNASLNDALIKMDSADRKKLLNVLPIKKLDSLKKQNIKKNTISISLWGEEYGKFKTFQDKYPKASIEVALDSLKVEKTFMNRFVYTRIKLIKEISQSDEKKQEFIKQLISYSSISLFVLLPLFTLFLKLLYIRRKFTYVEHLVFVFHTQTVFFLLMTIFYLLSYFNNQDYIVPIFLLMFSIYLYLAMKKFYNQGRIKTFIKYIFINISFSIVSTIGFFFVALLAFMLY